VDGKPEPFRGGLLIQDGVVPRAVWRLMLQLLQLIL
jgi:hypothetical protein